MYDDRPKITVAGEAVVNVKLDKLVVTLGIETWGIHTHTAISGNINREWTRITDKAETNWNRLGKMKDDEIDISDIPKVDREMFKTMVVRMPQPKELVSIRIDPDVLVWFRQQGGRYQTRINAVLRSYVEAHSH
jgi:uncharacterized protein (DUF4415 family)